MGVEETEHVPTVEFVEGVEEVCWGKRVGFREGFKKGGGDLRATRLEGELVRSKDVQGVGKDFVEAVYGSHLVQSFSNGDWTGTTGWLRDGHQGGRGEEVTAPLVEQAVPDEFDEVGKTSETVGVSEQREAVVPVEAGGAGSGAGGDVFLPGLHEGFVGKDRSVRSVVREWWDGRGVFGVEVAEGFDDVVVDGDQSSLVEGLHGAGEVVCVGESGAATNSACVGGSGAGGGG